MKKKVGIFLLISLLVISSVFAASTFTGKARLRLGAWNNNMGSGYDWKYGLMDKSEAELKFILQELVGSTTGEGKIFGEVEAEAAIRYKVGDDVSIFSGEWLSPKNIQYKLQFNKANIVFDKDKNFKLGIAGTWAQPRYARGWEVELDNGNLIESDPFFTYATAFEDYKSGNVIASGAWIPAITLEYDKFAFSFALDGRITKSANTWDDPGLVALFQANKLTVMDGMDVSVAAGYMQSNAMTLTSVTNNGTDFDASTMVKVAVGSRQLDYTANQYFEVVLGPNTGKTNAAGKTYYGIDNTSVGSQRHILFGFGLSYASDLVKLDLGLNGNYELTGNPWNYDTFNKINRMDNEPHGVEVSINFAYLGDFKINFDAWFLDNLGLWADANTPSFITYANNFDMGYVYRNAEGGWLGEDNGISSILHKALSMKLYLQPIDMLGITLRGQDLLNQMIIGLELPIYINDAMTLTPSFEFTAATNKTYSNGTWSLADGDTANAIYQGMLAFNYKHDLFNLYASLRVGSETLSRDKDGNQGVHVRPYVKLSSDALVDNLILSFVWEKATFGTQLTSPALKYYGIYSDQTQNFGDIYLEARINF